MPARYSVTVAPRGPVWQATCYVEGEGGRKRRWSTGVRLDGPGGRRVTERLAQRRAEEQAAGLVGDLRSHPPLDDAALGPLARRLLRAKLVDGRRSRAVESLGWVIDKRVLPHFGEARDARTIRRADLEAFKARLHADGLAPTSINNALTGIRQLLKQALVEELIDAVPPVGNVKTDPEGKGRALTAEEVQRLAAATYDAEARDWLLWLANTGLRRAEAFAARWSWVDWGAAAIHIPGAYRKRGKPLALPLSPAALAVLESRRQAQGDDWDEDGKIFLHEHDEARLRAAERAGLGRVTNHDLRYTRGSALHAAGVPLPEVRDLLGHSTLVMVNRYAQTYPERLRESAARVQFAVPGTVPGEQAAPSEDVPGFDTDGGAKKQG